MVYCAEKRVEYEKKRKSLLPWKVLWMQAEKSFVPK